MTFILRLIRPHQYLKNGFVLLGPLFAHEWGSQMLGLAGLTFLAFCAMASAVYVLNDIMDVEADRLHPVKCQRPLASGAVPLRMAGVLFALLVLLSLGLSLSVGFWVVVCTLSYLFINILYSWRLKHVVILDVFLISSGFMLRIMAGTVGLGIAPSSWLLLCGLMVTLFLGFSKRRAELLMLEGEEAGSRLIRRVLDDYNSQMLEQFIAISAACTILAYGLYTVAPQTIELHGSPNLIYTLPFVVYGIFRYLFLLHRRNGGSDTAKDLLQDPHLLLTAGLWVACTLWVLR